MQALILDFKLLEEQQLEIDEFLTLVYLVRTGKPYNNSSRVLENLQRLGFVKVIGEEIIIRETGVKFLDFISIDEVAYPKSKRKITKSETAVVAQIDNFIEEYRNKWKGLKPGSMGSLQGCKDKMLRWMKNNPKYTPEQILKAADMYLKSLSSTTYLQQADYFIYKQERIGESSRLSAFIDDIENNTIVEDGWTSNFI